MAASTVPITKRLGGRFASRLSALAVLALAGAMSAAATRGESVVLSESAHGFSGRRAAIGVEELAGLSLPALGASPLAAAAVHSATVAVIPPSDAPHRRGRAAKSLDKAPRAPNEAETAKLAVPEPATLVLGLTSTLVLGSLSWKRRLTHHHPSRA